MKISSELLPLILASASPRRSAILERLGLDFRIQPAGVEERLLPGVEPVSNAEHLARAKARAVAGRVEAGCVIGCDTLVAVGETMLGKPSSPGEARRILTFLRGKTQQVISGLCLIHVGSRMELSGHEVTTVYTRAMSDEEIEAYIATGECFGKAGAYAIQETGDRFIDKVEGSFDNVVGFPTELFLRMMARLSDLAETNRRT